MYNLFISHSWAYSDQYDRLVSLLNAAPNFDYRNYSVPKDDPIHNAPYQYQLKEAIRSHSRLGEEAPLVCGRGQRRPCRHQ